MAEKELSKREICILTEKMCHTTDLKELRELAEKLGMDMSEETLRNIQESNKLNL